MQQGSPKLELIDLRLRYPTWRHVETEGHADPSLAVDLKGTDSGTPIHISSGEFTIILGPSGCGKSSLLQMIAGLIKPSEGLVLKDGVPVTRPGRDRGMVFQSYTSFPWLTVEDNVLFGLKLRGSNGQSKKEKREKVREIVDLVGLSDSLHKYPKELSGGMKQRVAIARALANDPDVLLMDEPFGALDPHIRIKMQELMLAIERRLNTTILFVTHDAREAVFLGDTIYISTIRPCFLKYKIVHPFQKEELDREKARQKYSSDFFRFQQEVEGKMQFLIEHPQTPRVMEAEDQSTFTRSTMGVLQQLSDAYEAS